MQFNAIINRLITIKIKHSMSSFQKIGVFVPNNLGQGPNIATCMPRYNKTRERAGVNEKPLNLEKTTSSVLSIVLLLIYANIF